MNRFRVSKKSPSSQVIALRATLRVTTSNDKSQILEGKRARATCCRACAAATATRTRVVMADGAPEATARMAQLWPRERLLSACAASEPLARHPHPPVTM